MPKTQILQVRIYTEKYDQVRNDLNILARKENLTAGEMLEKLIKSYNKKEELL